MFASEEYINKQLEQILGQRDFPKKSSDFIVGDSRNMDTHEEENSIGRNIREEKYLRDKTGPHGKGLGPGKGKGCIDPENIKNVTESP